MQNALRLVSRHTVRPYQGRVIFASVSRPSRVSSPRFYSTSKPKGTIDPALQELIEKERETLDIEEKAEQQQQQATETKPAEADVLIEETESVIGEASTKEFQAETKKILDIVARSLYSDKEVFIRELISNASDALEKVRHLISTNVSVVDSDVPLEINVSVDEAKKTFTIQDTGIGMSKEELAQNLGRIGFSGTSEFMKVLEDKEKASNLIGQFGVGFYSAFMVGNKIKVYSKGHKEEGADGWAWESDGSGSYTLAQATPVTRGTKIIISLRQDSEEFSVKKTVENIIKTYSNFVGFKISLNGKQVNTVGAIWTKLPKDVTFDEHKNSINLLQRHMMHLVILFIFRRTCRFNLSLYFIFLKHIWRNMEWEDRNLVFRCFQEKF